MEGTLCVRIEICTSGCRVGPFQQPFIPPKKVSQKKESTARMWESDRGNALSGYCCNIILMERSGGRQQCGHMLYVKCAGCRWEPRKSGDGCTTLGVSAREKKASTMTHLKRFACRLQGHRPRECAQTLYISCKDRMGSVMVPGRRLWPSAISDGDERGGVSKRNA